MALDVIFSVRDGCGDYKNNYFKAFSITFSVILTISSFVNFLAYDVTLRHSYPVTILFSGRCNVLFGKSITCSLLKTQQVRNIFKGLWEINKRVKIWCNVRSYPGCPKLPRLTVLNHVLSCNPGSIPRLTCCADRLSIRAYANRVLINIFRNNRRKVLTGTVVLEKVHATKKSKRTKE